MIFQEQSSELRCKPFSLLSLNSQNPALFPSPFQFWWSFLLPCPESNPLCYSCPSKTKPSTKNSTETLLEGKPKPIEKVEENVGLFGCFFRLFWRFWLLWLHCFSNWDLAQVTPRWFQGETPMVSYRLNMHHLHRVIVESLVNVNLFGSWCVWNKNRSKSHVGIKGFCSWRTRVFDDSGVMVWSDYVLGLDDLPSIPHTLKFKKRCNQNRKQIQPPIQFKSNLSQTGKNMIKINPSGNKSISHFWSKGK